MLYNQASPRIEIDPGTARIAIDGQRLPALPENDFPLNRRYFLNSVASRLARTPSS